MYNCQRKAGYHDDALDTLAMEINCISIKQLTDDGISPYILSCWVKACCSVSTQYKLATYNIIITIVLFTVNRSIVDVLEPHLSNHVITTILEAELIECRKSVNVIVFLK